MKSFINPLFDMDIFNEILSSIKNYTMPISITGPSESQKVHLATALGYKLKCLVIYITFNDYQASKAFEDFSFLFGEEALYFPSRQLILHNIEAKTYDDVYARINALDRILNGDYSVLVTSAEALMNRLPDRDFFLESVVDISQGDRLNSRGILQKFAEMGYERVSVVEGKGQFTVRGGIIDIYSPSSEYAARIELFDDIVDSIRFFDVISQRSIENLKSLHIIPAREVIFKSSDKPLLAQKLSSELAKYVKTIKNEENAKSIRERVSEDKEALMNSSYFPGIDRYIAIVLEKYSTLLDYVGHTSVVFIDEYYRVGQRVDNVMMEHEEISKSLLEKGSILPSAFDILLRRADIDRVLEKVKSVELYTMPAERMNHKLYSIPSKGLSSYRGHIELLIDDIRYWKNQNYKIIILTGTRVRGMKLKESLEEKGIEANFYKSTDDILELLGGTVTITTGSINSGFEYPSIGFVVISDKEILGQDRKSRRYTGKIKGDKIKSFTDLRPGDYVVHRAHGIGQYVGIEKLNVENIKKDYLKIRYLQGDYLYIPTSQLDLIQKFIGAEGKAPKLSRLGGSEWNKKKAKVKESLKEIADELIKLYAQRQSIKGHPFSTDTVWQTQFEELFPYEETEDQLKCIEEVKLDMESDRLMDRLLCGDVGYGKTEVAIRAAFKAVMDGKQVAYLVPTTILAQQHYNTFKDRTKDFPVKVEVISRFRTKSEQSRIVKDIKSGMIDVLIGTHRLVQKDIQFKDIGLLIIDEEHRFGVGHKEKLKGIKPNVDVLTLTATPIPRTLHMSLAGIRDISMLEDPPEERYPVQTFVMEHNSDVVKDAITRELARGGQIFYLYNRVRSIDLKAIEIQNLVPEARIAVAHGQMNEQHLENIMFEFLNGEYDILVCTTIIESGLDMPNVNTIIVENSDKMGLAQLYQLRGRVGRSNRLAYAYITYKKDKVLSEVAEKRLKAIKEFTEFGSGFKIAMKDLEIRGAGNLLGAEQSGHIASVGYDMYCRLLNEAISEIKGDIPLSDEKEIQIDLSIDAYIEEDYIEDEVSKIDMYKKIASIQDEEDADDVKDELIDRYGDLPKPVGNLIDIALIKSIASSIEIVSISQKNKAVTFHFSNDKKINIEAISKLVAANKRKLLLSAGNSPYITYRITDEEVESLLSNIKILLHDAKNFAV